MPRTTFAGFVLPLLAVALTPLGKAVAGPPEGASGKMVFVDKVAEGLGKYHAETDAAKRIERLTALAATRDPRVAVVLGELFERGLSATRAEYPDPGVAANVLLHVHYVPGGGNNKAILGWWKANEADLRRRAKQLPQ